MKDLPIIKSNLIKDTLFPYTPVALALAFALLPAENTTAATLNVNGTSISTTAPTSYKNSSVAPAINVSNGGNLLLNHLITASTDAPFARAIQLTGAASNITVNAPLDIALGAIPQTFGLDINAGTVTVQNGRVIINSTANSTNGAGPIGVNATNGANINLGSNASISLGSSGSTLPGTHGIRVSTGAAGLRDTVVKANDISIKTQGTNSAAVLVWNSVAVLGNAQTKNGEVTLTGTNNTITTTGKQSAGLATGTTTHGKSRIRVGNATTPSRVTIVTSGQDSSGLYVTTNGEIALQGDNQSISTSGINAHGIEVAGNSLAKNTDSKPQATLIGDNFTISTSGKTSHGLFANQGGDITLKNNVTGNNKIQATGSGAHAVYARGQRKATDTPSSITLNQKGGSITSANGDLLRAEGAKIDVTLDKVTTNNPNGKLIYAGLLPAATASGVKGTIGSFVSLNASNGTSLTGDIYADTLSTANLMLNNSSWTGSAENGSVNLGANSTWMMTRSSTLSDLNNVGSMSFGDTPNKPLASRSYRTLTLNNRLSGNGEFIMRVNMQKQVGDKLVVKGSSAGNHTLTMLGDAGQVTNGTERLTVVQTQDGNAKFALKGNQSVDFGGYQYQLSRTANNKDWELKGAATGGNSSGSGTSNGGNSSGGGAGGGGSTGGGKSLSSAADATVNAIIGNYLVDYAETQTLLQRMGELRQDGKEYDVWARGYAGRVDSFAKGLLDGFTMDYHGFQLGADKRLPFAGGNVWVGAMFGAANSSQDYAKNGGNGGNGGINSQSAGVYASYLNDNGLYVDGLIKYNHLDNSYRVKDSSNARITGESKTNGVGVSFEAGQRFWFNSGKEGFYIEPQAQLSWSWQEGISSKASNGLRVESDDLNSVIGRVGTLVGYSVNTSNSVNLYYKTAFVGEMAGDVNYRLNGSRESEKMRGGWWNNGIGIRAQIANQHTLFMDAEVSSGHQFTQSQLNAGYRYSF